MNFFWWCLLIIKLGFLPTTLLLKSDIKKVIIWGLRFTGEGLVVAKWNMLRKSVNPSQLHCQSLPRYFLFDSPQNAKFHQQPYFDPENWETDRVSSNHGEVYHFAITRGSTMTKVCARVCRYFCPIPPALFYSWSITHLMLLSTPISYWTLMRKEMLVLSRAFVQTFADERCHIFSRNSCTRIYDS